MWTHREDEDVKRYMMDMDRCASWRECSEGGSWMTWRLARMHKIVLAAKSEEQLRGVATKLDEGRILHKLWVRGSWGVSDPPFHSYGAAQVEQPEGCATCLATKVRRAGSFNEGWRLHAGEHHCFVCPPALPPTPPPPPSHCSHTRGRPSGPCCAASSCSSRASNAAAKGCRLAQPGRAHSIVRRDSQNRSQK